MRPSKLAFGNAPRRSGPFDIPHTFDVNDSVIASHAGLSKTFQFRDRILVPRCVRIGHDPAGVAVAAGGPHSRDHQGHKTGAKRHQPFPPVPRGQRAHATPESDSTCLSCRAPIIDPRASTAPRGSMPQAGPTRVTTQP